MLCDLEILSLYFNKFMLRYSLSGIIASGLSGSTATAQSQVSVGMGLLAGSTVMLLTILWSTCLVVGKCDLENSVAVDQKNTKVFSLTGNFLDFY